MYLEKTKALIMYAEIFNWTIMSDFVSSLDSLKKLVLWLVCCPKKNFMLSHSVHSFTERSVFIRII